MFLLVTIPIFAIRIAYLIKRGKLWVPATDDDARPVRDTHLAPEAMPEHTPAVEKNPAAKKGPVPTQGSVPTKDRVSA